MLIKIKKTNSLQITIEEKKISTNHGKRGFIRIELRSSTRNMRVIQNVKWSIGFVKMSSLRFWWLSSIGDLQQESLIE